MINPNLEPSSSTSKIPTFPHSHLAVTVTVLFLLELETDLHPGENDNTSGQSFEFEES